MSIPAGGYAIVPGVTSGSPYTAGFSVGGKQSIGNAQPGPLLATLQSVTLLDKSNQKAALTILFFASDPTAAGTPATVADFGAFAWGTANTLFLGKLDIAAADYETIASQAVATKANLNMPLQVAQGSTLFGVAVTTGTPTYTSTSALIFTYGLTQLR
jgi:hypothetical protein